MTVRTPSKQGKAKAPARKAPASRPKAPKAPRPAGAQADGARADPAVLAFLRGLEHPLKREIEAVRQLILGASPGIHEGLKWNAPSFYTTDHFATFNLRPKDRVTLILHTGAKVKGTAQTGVKVDDPAGLLEWLAKDRCLVTLEDAEDIQARGPALQAVVREWLRYV